MRNYLFIIIFFCTLVGHRFEIMTGVSWADVFTLIQVFLLLVNWKYIKFRNDIISKFTFGYLVILIVSSLLNGTFENTVFINIARNYTEGIIAYVALTNSLKSPKIFRFFTYLSVIFIILYLSTSRNDLIASLEESNSYAALDFEFGRNSFAVTNLLIIILTTFVIYIGKLKYSKYLWVLYPVMLFNIYLSASRFSNISLVIFTAFMLYMMKGRLTFQRIVLGGLAIIALYYVMPTIAGTLDSDVVSYGADLLYNKLATNHDGGLFYRLYNLNYLVIVEWLEAMPVYLWLFGDGISITHGVFSFTFCCTGLVGLVYFCSTNFIMIKRFWDGTKTTNSFIACLVLIFFLNDIVTNSRFIVGLNTLIYMGVLAYMYAYHKLLTSLNNDKP